jgi:hypothetical protein
MTIETAGPVEVLLVLAWPVALLGLAWVLDKVLGIGWMIRDLLWPPAEAGRKEPEHDPYRSAHGRLGPARRRPRRRR